MNIDAKTLNKTLANRVQNHSILKRNDIPWPTGVYARNALYFHMIYSASCNVFVKCCIV